VLSSSFQDLSRTTIPAVSVRFQIEIAAIRHIENESLSDHQQHIVWYPLGNTQCPMKQKKDPLPKELR
jgi:hypothetical protein